TSHRNPHSAPAAPANPLPSDASPYAPANPATAALAPAARKSQPIASRGRRWVSHHPETRNPGTNAAICHWPRSPFVSPRSPITANGAVTKRQATESHTRPGAARDGSNVAIVEVSHAPIAPPRPEHHAQP